VPTSQTLLFTLREGAPGKGFLFLRISRQDETALHQATGTTGVGEVLAVMPRGYTVEITADDQAQLQDAIVRISHSLGDPDRVAAVRIALDAVCAELDVAPRPVDAKRLH